MRRFSTLGGANGLLKSLTGWRLGGSFRLSCPYICKAKPTWRMLLMQAIRLPFSLALDRTGKSIAARIAMIAITTSNSISVKAPQVAFRSRELDCLDRFIRRDSLQP